jgi:NADPH:quinone reductase-like Zn-dependent oxidoreductase
MADYLTSLGLVVDLIEISSVETAPCTRVLFLLEAEKPFFVDATPAEWAGFQQCVRSAQSALWVSAGDLLDGREPAFAMISGVVRGLRTEMSKLRLGSLDLENTPSALDLPIFKDIAKAESRLANGSVADDSEFRMKNGLLYISRLVADDALNTQFKDITEQALTTQETPLKELRSTPIQLDIEKPGVLSTLYFREDAEFSHPLQDDCVEIEVLFAGVNNKDIAVVTGRHHSNTFSDECAGRITKVGASVTQFKPGDKVYCQSFAKFGNFVRDKALFCQKIHPDDSLADSVTMPIAFCTAIYGLMELGRLQKGESVLIQSATGAVGLAAVQIARMCGAEIFATVGTPEKKSALLAMGYGIAEDHIFGSRDLASASIVLEVTNGRGIDVILCSSRGQLMHDYWTCIAPCGRFIEIGRTEILDSGKLNLDVFRRNALFASFDLEVLSKDSPATIGRYVTLLY